MPAKRLLLGILVTAVWGFNFSVIKVAEGVFQPFMLSTLRFVFCAFPAVFFLPRPKVPLRFLVAYGLVFGVLQFGLLFADIEAGLSAGLSSVVLQVQVFFTILFSALLTHDRIRQYQIAGIVLGFAGVGIIFAVGGSSMTVAGVLLTAAGGAAWGLANVIAKMAEAADPIGFMVWASLVPILPLVAITIGLEGVSSISWSFQHLTWGSVGSVRYLVYPTTLFGYTVWNSLLRKYPTSVVAPLTLLVPVFGLAGSMLLFSERLTAMKVLAVLLMISGLAVNQFWPRLPRWHGAPASAVASAVAEDAIPAAATVGPEREKLQEGTLP